MNKKTARLQRWLDRLSVACDSRRWDSAVVEADCLSAEVRELRDDLWKMAVESPAPHARIFSRSAVTMTLRSAAIAMLIVMASTLPIAVEADRPWSAPTVATKAEKETEHLGWVTQEEEELLHVLRTELNSAKPAAASAVKPAPARRNVAKQTPPAQLESAPRKSSGADIRPEDLLSLIQAGEKALRGGEPAIRVIE